MNLQRDKNGMILYEGNPVYVKYIKGDFLGLVYNRKTRQHEKRYYYGRVGVAVALRMGEEIRYGWSKLNLRAGDKWNKNISLTVAIGRALYHNEIQLPFTDYYVVEDGEEVIKRIPQRVQECLLDVYDMAQRHLLHRKEEA